MKRNSKIHSTKFSENCSLNFGYQNVIYMVYLVGHAMMHFFFEQQIFFMK